MWGGGPTSSTFRPIDDATPGPQTPLSVHVKLERGDPLVYLPGLFDESVVWVSSQACLHSASISAHLSQSLHFYKSQ